MLNRTGFYFLLISLQSLLFYHLVTLTIIRTYPWISRLLPTPWHDHCDPHHCSFCLLTSKRFLPPATPTTISFNLHHPPYRSPILLLRSFLTLFLIALATCDLRRTIISWISFASLVHSFRYFILTVSSTTQAIVCAILHSASNHSDFC